MMTTAATTAVSGDELARIELLAGLGDDALAELAAGACRKIYATGDVAVHEGGAPDALHLVRRGLFAVVRPSIEPWVVVDRLHPGDAFGELAVLAGARRAASVVAVETAETLAIAREDLDRVLLADPVTMRAMVASLARALARAGEEAALRTTRVEDTVRELTADLRESQLEVVRRLSHAAESRDDTTGAHITRMSRMCAALGRAAALPEAEVELLLHAASMHDIGKIAIPDRILLKPGPLEPDEWELMKSHTVVGAEMLAGATSPVVQMGEIIARSHHEKWDGTGYPVGLRGDAIPLVARICAVCDVYDALVSDRPYKAAWPVDRALGELRRLSGRHLDPRLVALFVERRPDLRAEA